MTFSKGHTVKAVDNPASANRTKHPCPDCGGPNARIIDSRPSGLPGIMRNRRYFCTVCKSRFSTAEIPMAKMTDRLIDSQREAREFLELVDAAARKVFGDENGHFTSNFGRER